MTGTSEATPSRDQDLGDEGRPLRIVRLANFVMARSGGLRTALRCLGEGYQAAGHEAILVVPGATTSEESIGGLRIITLPGPALPGTGCSPDAARWPGSCRSWPRTGWRSRTGPHSGGPAGGHAHTACRR
jgi:hypothetical protein